MPTIRKRGDGQCHVQIRKRGYPTQTKTFTEEADARRWATIIESEMERGVFVSRTEAEATLVREVLRRYAEEVLPTKRSETVFPKGLDLSDYSQGQLDAVANHLNARPRKTLDYDSPAQ